MDTKRVARFFSQRDWLPTLGGVVAALGLALLFFGYSAFSYYAGCVMIPVGAVTFIALGARAVPESEIRQAMEKAMQGLGQDVQAEPTRWGVAGQQEPVCAQGMYFTAYATAFRRGKDAVLLSDAYAKTLLYQADDALVVRSRRVTLSDGACEDTALRVEWRDLQGAQLVPYEQRVKLTNTKNAEAVARGVLLVLKDRQGKDIFCAPIRNDVDAEQLCASIARRCVDRT